MTLWVIFRVGCRTSLLAGLFAVTALFAAAAEAPDSADQSYAQGVEALRHAQWKSAVAAFEQALSLDPHRADAANGLGVAFGKLGDASDSESAFRRAIAIDPAFAEAH